MQMFKEKTRRQHPVCRCAAWCDKTEHKVSRNFTGNTRMRQLGPDEGNVVLWGWPLRGSGT